MNMKPRLRLTTLSLTRSQRTNMPTMMTMLRTISLRRRGTRKRIRIRLRRQPDRRLSQLQHWQLQVRCATRFQHRTTPDPTQSPTTGQRRCHRLAQRGSRRPPRRCRYRRQRRGRRQQPRCELLREREMRRERREREDDHGGGRRPRGTTRPHQSQRDPDAGMGKRRLRQSGVGGDARPHRHPGAVSDGVRAAAMKARRRR